MMSNYQLEHGKWPDMEKYATPAKPEPVRQTHFMGGSPKLRPALTRSESDPNLPSSNYSSDFVRHDLRLAVRQQCQPGSSGEAKQWSRSEIPLLGIHTYSEVFKNHGKVKRVRPTQRPNRGPMNIPFSATSTYRSMHGGGAMPEPWEQVGAKVTWSAEELCSNPLRRKTTTATEDFQEWEVKPYQKALGIEEKRNLGLLPRPKK